MTDAIVIALLISTIVLAQGIQRWPIDIVLKDAKFRFCTWSDKTSWVDH